MSAWDIQFRQLVSEARRAREAHEASFETTEPMLPLPPEPALVEFIPNEGVCGCNRKRLGPCLVCIAIDDHEQRQRRKGP